MGSRSALILVTWNGASWVGTRAQVSGSSALFSIDHSIEVAGDIATFPAALRSALRIGRRNTLIFVNMVLPLMVKEVSVPLVASEKQAATIESEVARAVPFRLDEIAWDAVVLEEDVIEQRVLLIVARTVEWIAVPGALSAVSRHPRGESLPVALINLWRCLSPRVHPSAVVVFPLKDFSLVLLDGGERARVRIVRCGVGNGSPEARNRLRTECIRSIAAHRREDVDWAPEELWLLGPEAEAFLVDGVDFGGLKPRILAEGMIKEKLPIEHLDRVPVHHRLVVAGALLAQTGEPYLGSELLPAAERMRAAARTYRPLLWASAAMFLAAGWVVFGPAWRERQQLENELKTLRGQIIPVAKCAADLGRVEQAIERERAAIFGIADLARSRTNWTHFMADIQARLSVVENVWIDSLEVIRAADAMDLRSASEIVSDASAEEDVSSSAGRVLRLQLVGRLLDPDHPLQRVSPEMRARVNDLIDGLAGSDYVLAVTDKRFEPREAGLLRFSFSLTIDPEHRL